MNYRIKFGADFPPGIPQTGSNSTCKCLFGSRLSAATANIPNPRLRAEIAPVEQSRLSPCCDLTRKTKRTRPCIDCPTYSLHMILRMARTIVRSQWSTPSVMYGASIVASCISHPPQHCRRIGAARGVGQSAAAAGWVRGEAGGFTVASRHQPLDGLPMLPSSRERDRGPGSFSLGAMAKMWRWRMP